MLNTETIICTGKLTVEKYLSLKEDSAVLKVSRGDTGSFVLRIYAQEVPAYRTLEWHDCESFPQVYRTYMEEGVFVVEEEFIDGVSLHEMLVGGARMDEKRTANIAL